MTNKFLLFPLLGVVLPVLLYVGTIEFKKKFLVTTTDVGELNTEAQSTNDRKSEEIILVGDVLLARNVERLIIQNGTSYPFIKLSTIIGTAPVVIGNFESAILKKHVRTPSFVTTFSTDSNLLPTLVDAGFTHFSLANNHSFDYGEETLQNTGEALSLATLKSFGHPHNSTSSMTTTFTSGDYTIGVIALNEVFRTLPWMAIEASLTELASTTDYQIAYIHFGDEYMLKHNQIQENTAKRLIDLSVDAVVGHHPHVVQDIEIYKDKPIFYSLGNFLFDQYFSVDVQQGLALKLALATSTVEFTLLPISSEGTLSQPYPMPKAEATLFLKNLARRSDLLYSENIVQGKLILPLNLATY